MKKLFLGILVVLLFTPLVFVQPQIQAATGSIYFSPSSGSKTNGQSFTVAVRVNTDGSDAIHIVFTYPTDKLTFGSIDASGSAWGIAAPSGESGGTVTIDRGNIGTVTGDVLVANMSFTPKVGTGTATLSMSSSSEVLLGGLSVTTGRSNATFTLTEPASSTPTPSTPSTPSTGSKTTPKTTTPTTETTTTTTEADTKAPIVTEDKTTELTKTTATVTWKTDEAATSKIEWGPTSEYGLTLDDANLLTEHTLKLDSKLLIPGQTYYYRIISSDSAGNASEGKSKTFKVPGYEVKIKITGSDGKPIEGAVVKMDGEEAKTDKDGIATFKDRKAGKETVLAEFEKQSGSAAISVAAQETAQTFEVKVAGVSSDPNTLTAVLGGVATFLLLVQIVTFIHNRRKTRFSETIAQTPINSVR